MRSGLTHKTAPKSKIICFSVGPLHMTYFIMTIEVRNGYLYSCSCPDSFKFCKHIFLVSRIFQVPFTEHSRLHVTPVTDENAALSNTVEEMPNDAFGNIQNTSNMDE
ncbi:hypothetical protein RMATCC62417_18301 [Rhizopus microsporus]|nr:hypothetical protein RMATCC62417_18301 [Rhizopus microsporus]